MVKSKIFIFLCLSFLAGVLAASLFNISNFLFLIFLAASAASAAFCYYLGKQLYFFICVCVIFALLGGLRLNSSFVPGEFTTAFGQKTQLEGFVVEDPDIRLDKQLLTIKPKNYSQNILVTVNLTQEFFYGDEVVMDGKIEEAKNFSEFDYKGYLEMKNIYALSNRPKILILRSGQLNFFKLQVLKIKHKFTGRVAGLLEEPESSLLLGILIGAKKTLPSNITDSFNRAGLSHIIAVSGYNISIIAGALSYAAWVLGRRRTFWLSLLFIIAFTVLTGASASVIRAAIMGLLLLVAYHSGRLYSITASLCLAAALMALFNPKILVWDVGFELSFLATAGIIYGVPVLQKLTKWWKRLEGLKNILLTTLCAIVATLPLLLFKFGQLSVIAVLANLLILPLVPPIMLIGFLSVLPFFGSGFAFVAGLLLKLIIALVNLLTSWKYASISLKISGLTFVILSGAVLLLYYWLKQASLRAINSH